MVPVLQESINFLNFTKSWKIRAVVVALLVEHSLPTPEIRSSNPGIGIFYILSPVLKSMN